MALLKGLLRQRKYAEALAAAESYLREKPRHVGLLSAAASAAFALGRNEEALQFIRRALYIQPESAVLKDSLRKIQKRIDDEGESS